MSSKLPTSVLTRPRALVSSSTSSTRCLLRPQQNHAQVRHATFVPRDRRPYQFTQLVQLSDGSTFTVRTTMPTALLKSTKDSRNHMLWQPQEKSLRNVEVDEAGKLAAFRERFGRGWDIEAKPEEEEGGEADESARQAEAQAKTTTQNPELDPFDSLVDLISGYAAKDANNNARNTKGGLTAKEQEKAERASSKKK
ncbi:hypothetical protein B0T22DRAFT_466584 [Podospora appendiculata]|uniref:Ribosomal protein bL31m N-terminal domain-containing protein n=1 Tax=Podospora appendiculata TaxID=314037 RepID=A0AAE0X653_9PEZI|nr:hypothetical protein B0T22DRAFT_466584 [Podospora appendiculata]